MLVQTCSTFYMSVGDLNLGLHACLTIAFIAFTYSLSHLLSPRSIGLICGFGCEYTGVSLHMFKCTTLNVVPQVPSTFSF